MKNNEYIHFDFNNPDNISLEQVKDFLIIGVQFIRLVRRQNARITKLEHKAYQSRSPAFDDLSDIIQSVYIKNLIKKVANLCHIYLVKYKKYDRIEIVQGTRKPCNIGKNERLLFYHKLDFYKYVAYNLTISGYDKKDISELISLIY